MSGYGCEDCCRESKCTEDGENWDAMMRSYRMSLSLVFREEARRMAVMTEKRIQHTLLDVVNCFGYTLRCHAFDWGLSVVAFLTLTTRLS